MIKHLVRYVKDKANEWTKISLFLCGQQMADSFNDSSVMVTDDDEDDYTYHQSSSRGVYPSRDGELSQLDN